MEITVNQDQFMHALQVVHRAAASKSSMPVLNGIYLRATAPDILYLAATDMEIGISLTIDAQVKEEGAIVLPARILTEAVRRLPNAPLDIAVDMTNFRAQLTWGARSSFDIHGVEPEQFPTLPEEKEEWGMDLNSETLKQIILQVIFATSQSDRRPILAGVLFELKEGNLTTAAVDYARLVVRKLKLDGRISGEGQRSVIPARILNEVIRILGSDDRQVEIKLSTSHAFFTIRDMRISARLLEGQFPAYEQFVPTEEKHVAHMVLNTEELLQAVDRMSLVSTDDDRTVRMQMQEQGVLMSASTPQLGEAEEEIAANCTGELMDIYFNVKYLQEGLRHVEEETVALNLTGKESAATLTFPESTDFIYVIMPLRSEGDQSAV